jgi:NADH-quinone oxidoreductase subunit C
MDIRTRVPTIYGDWWERFGPTWRENVAALQEKFGGSITEVRFPPEYPTDVPIVYVDKESIVPVLTFLRDSLGYDFLADITATDEEKSPRFEVVYNLYAQKKKGPRIRVKTRVGENEDVPSATPVWPGADWAEREVYDMFGVKFRNHPNLRRILMDYRWEGYPLRKDYPLDGYQVFPDAEPPDPERLK